MMQALHVVDMFGLITSQASAKHEERPEHATTFWFLFILNSSWCSLFFFTHFVLPVYSVCSSWCRNWVLPLFFGGSSSSSSSASSSSSGPAYPSIFASRFTSIHRWLTSLTVALAISISITTEEGAVAMLEIWRYAIRILQCLTEGCEEGEGRFQEKGTLYWSVIPSGARVDLWHQSLLLCSERK